MAATDNTAHKLAYEGLNKDIPWMRGVQISVHPVLMEAAATTMLWGRNCWRNLCLRQLTQNPDNGCEPLGKQGARGAPFGLTLDSYGYTYVAQGTVTAFYANLKHEGLVYQHLAKV